MNELIPLPSIDEEGGMNNPKTLHFISREEALLDDNDNASTDNSVEEEDQYDGYADVQKMEVIALHSVMLSILYALNDVYYTMYIALCFIIQYTLHYVFFYNIHTIMFY